MNEDLENLLDDALQDFDNLSKKTNDSKESTSKPQKVSSPSEEEFLAIFAAAGQGEAEGTASEAPPGRQQSGIQEKLSQTLNELTQSSACLSEQPSEEELQRLLMSCGLSDGAEPNLDNLLPMMEGMMQSLLSKELLYPALKEMADKFPDWLANNRSKISESQYDIHNKQFHLTKKICFKYEAEKERDSEAVKKARFQEVMELMQEMQGLGQPPRELTGDQTPAIQFDQAGNPILPGLTGDPSQCSIQ